MEVKIAATTEEASEMKNPHPPKTPDTGRYSFLESLSKKIPNLEFPDSSHEAEYRLYRIEKRLPVMNYSWKYLIFIGAGWQLMFLTNYFCGFQKSVYTTIWALGLYVLGGIFFPIMQLVQNCRLKLYLLCCI